MLSPPADPPSSPAGGALAHAAHVHPAEALVVDSGANAGDVLGPPGEAVCGDYYRLSDSHPPRLLRLRLAQTPAAAGHVAQGSQIGTEGAAVELEGRLSLMAPDGDLVEVLVLSLAEHGRFALPLSPLRAGQLHTLIAATTEPGSLRLAETMLGAFAGGTRIHLADGTPHPVELLAPGMEILTRDHGPQVLRWTGAVRLRAEGSFAPVVVQAGVMGNPRPLAVSPHHRLFLYRRDARALAGAAELLVQARHLVDDKTIHRREGGLIAYHGLVFDSHEVIYAEGVPCESLLVCPETLTRLPEDLAAPLRAAFPGLNQRLHTGTDIGAHLVSRLGTGIMARR